MIYQRIGLCGASEKLRGERRHDSDDAFKYPVKLQGVFRSLGKEATVLLELPRIEPRYNIAPSQQVAAIRTLADNEHREFVMLKWGLIPGQKTHPLATR